VSKLTIARQQPESPEPESEVLRHRVEQSVTRMIGLAEPLRIIGDNWGTYTADIEGVFEGLGKEGA